MQATNKQVYEVIILLGPSGCGSAYWAPFSMCQAPHVGFRVQDEVAYLFLGLENECGSVMWFGNVEEQDFNQGTSTSPFSKTIDRG